MFCYFTYFHIALLLCRNILNALSKWRRYMATNTLMNLYELNRIFGLELDKYRFLEYLDGLWTFQVNRRAAISLNAKQNCFMHRNPIKFQLILNFYTYQEHVVCAWYLICDGILYRTLNLNQKMVVLSALTLMYCRVLILHVTGYHKRNQKRHEKSSYNFFFLIRMNFMPWCNFGYWTRWLAVSCVMFKHSHGMSYCCNQILASAMIFWNSVSVYMIFKGNFIYQKINGKIFAIEKSFLLQTLPWFIFNVYFPSNHRLIAYVTNKLRITSVASLLFAMYLIQFVRGLNGFFHVKRLSITCFVFRLKSTNEFSLNRWIQKFLINFLSIQLHFKSQIKLCHLFDPTGFFLCRFYYSIGFRITNVVGVRTDCILNEIFLILVLF